jgi:hypothetical protein
MKHITKYIKLLHFLFFFKKIRKNWPNVHQRQMFLAAESGHYSYGSYPRHVGATTFAVVYALWLSEWHPDQVILLTTRYGHDLANHAHGYRDKLFVESREGRPSFEGLSFPYVVVENERFTDEQIEPLERMAEKFVKVYTEN